MSDPEIPLRELSHRLLAWFLKNKRELPWRGEHDPYRIWISEVMLQQTRSDTAASYYLRWLTRFPDIRSLSQADEQQVLKAWEGLGSTPGPTTSGGRPGSSSNGSTAASPRPSSI